MDTIKFKDSQKAHDAEEHPDFYRPAPEATCPVCIKNDIHTEAVWKKVNGLDTCCECGWQDKKPMPDFDALNIDLKRDQLEEDARDMQIESDKSMADLMNES